MQRVFIVVEECSASERKNYLSKGVIHRSRGNKFWQGDERVSSFPSRYAASRGP